MLAPVQLAMQTMHLPLQCRYCLREQVLGKVENGEVLGSSSRRAAQQHWGRHGRGSESPLLQVPGWETSCMGSCDPAAPHLPAREPEPSGPQPSAQVAHPPQRALISSMLCPLLTVLDREYTRAMADFHMGLPLAFVR